VYATVHESSDDSEYEHFYSTVEGLDDQPIYCLPDGDSDEEDDDDDMEYFTPTDGEGTPPPLPPRTEVRVQQPFVMNCIMVFFVV